MAELITLEQLIVKNGTDIECKDCDKPGSNCYTPPKSGNKKDN
jgi:hypothetical protein